MCIESFHISSGQTASTDEQCLCFLDSHNTTTVMTNNPVRMHAMQHCLFQTCINNVRNCTMQEEAGEGEH